MRKLGLIAGGGTLPISLARYCLASGREIFIVRLRGMTDPDLAAFPGADVGLAELGKAIRLLRDASCKSVCLAGHVSRPDFSTLKPDLRGLAALPGAIAAARQGDDGLLSFLVGEFEKEGFVVEGADEVAANLTLSAGALGERRPQPEHLADIARAIDAARAIGALDAGQGAVCCDGLILALEAQEGTDAMLGRVAKLPREIRGDGEHRRGVLAKVCKPGQEARVDLPTIGPRTVRGAAEAGLAGIVGEACRILVLERAEVVALADALGLFIVGVE
jgi:DUF1009 family protein